MWKVYRFINKTYNEKEKCYKSYIGITLLDIKERFSYHCLPSSHCIAFHAAIVKYGKDNWDVEILHENILSEKEALTLESFYIKKYNTLTKNGKGYNIVLVMPPREIINGELMCYACHIMKKVEMFSKDKKYECGKTAWCKDCKRKYNALVKEERLKTDKIYVQKMSEKIKNFPLKNYINLHQ